MEARTAAASLTLSWWERLVRVEAADAETARRGRIFNILMVISTGLVTYIAGLFIASHLLGYLDRLTAIIAAAFPLAFVPISIACMVLSKRGHLRRLVPAYVWLNFVGISLAAFVFDGPTSVAWLLFLWTITIAGTLIAPRYSLIMTGLVLGYYFLLLGAMQLGVYTAPIALPPQAQSFLIYGIILAMLVTTAGLLTYLNMRSLNSTLSDLVTTAQELERSQLQLEQRVEERTQALQRRAAQFRAIIEVNQGIAGAAELGALLQTAAELIGAHFGYTHVGIYLVDDLQEWLRLHAASGGVALQLFEARGKLRLGQPGLVQNAVATARAQLTSAAADLAVWRGQAEGAEIRAEMALPLKTAGRIIGVLDILSAEAGAFDQAAREALDVMANSLAATIVTVRLLSETRNSLARLERYQEEDAVRGWRMALARRNRRLDYAYDRLEITTDMPEDISRLVAAHPLAGLEVIEREGVYWLLAPLRVQQQLLGMLTFESSRPWTEDQRRLTETVVDQLGLALENARLLEDTRLSAQRERARGEIVGRVRSSVQIDAVLRSAVEELGRALQVERARIQLLPPAAKVGEKSGG